VADATWRTACPDSLSENPLQLVARAEAGGRDV
jgi:hypothetical protein